MTGRILRAARLVLEKRGAREFTTNHVAATAKISVGSLYQYYPNKEAILYELELAETRETVEELCAIFARADTGYERRFQMAIAAYFASENRERELRHALRFFSESLAHQRELLEIKGRAVRAVADFLRAWKSPGSEVLLEQMTNLVLTTIMSIAEAVTNRNASPAELARWVAHTEAMLLQRLKQVQHA